jgi:hypothetical protein
MKKELSHEQFIELITTIAEPTLKYMVKRINNKIVDDKISESITLNLMIAIIIGSLAVINVSTLKWMSNSTLEKTGEKIDIQKLRMALIENINNQLGLQ